MNDLTQKVHESTFSSWKVLAFVSRLLLWIITLITYRIPKLAITLLQWTGVLNLTLEFTAVKIILLLVALVVAISTFVKIKYLNRYTTLKEVPLAKDAKFDLHPDVATEEAQGNGYNNYLDEFLSAIKVFGYLEKPVFHELARHLQTRRLIAGDTLSLDSDHSFYIVVDVSS